MNFNFFNEKTVNQGTVHLIEIVYFLYIPDDVALG